ncbi:MAG: DUF1294 domain-containing protein [Pseudomonadales bacterium]|nr:DUF1294 domain-containing protein [Pseudomonadales bacterium]
MTIRKILFLLTLLILAASYFSGYTPLLVGAVFGIFSSITYLYYAIDKRAAIKGTWRVPENTLHFLALCCGWPGALLAQDNLRHKTRKVSFRLVFVITALVNASAIAWIHTPEGCRQLRGAIMGFHQHVEPYVESEQADELIRVFMQYRELPDLLR